jgi:methylmalonyl-CoA mutase N-terminal domain/subunit
MFTREIWKKDRAMVERWQKRVAETKGGNEFRARTSGGIPLKPLYTPSDMDHIHYDEIAIPGEFPYTRGFEPLGYQSQGWMMRQPVAVGLTKDTRERAEFLERLGWGLTVGDEGEKRLSVYNTALDCPSQQGYEPDAPEARGRVGRDGMSLGSIRDLDALFQGRDLEKTEVFFATPDGTLNWVAQYIVYAERHGIPQAKLRLKAGNTTYRSWFWDTAAYPPKQAMKLCAELIAYLIKRVPMAQVQSIEGYNPSEAGGTPVQEVAFCLATAITITEECIKVGLNPDDFLPKFHGHNHTSLDLFETVAKFRAMKKMWARIFKERFGCKKPEALKFRIYPQTGGSLLHRKEPENNIIRVTIMALAQVLSGTDGVWTASYDECSNIPSEKAAQIALRTQQIIYHETNIPAVVDPLGGSYYVEWLTKKIEGEAYSLLEEIDKRGGYIKCWESGWFRSELAREARKWQEAIDRGEKVMVGANRYVVEKGDHVPMFKVDPKVEDEAIRRIKSFKAERDNGKAKAALNALREALEKMKNEWPGSCGLVMPALIDAFRADCTYGETQGIMKEVLGYGYYGDGS